MKTVKEVKSVAKKKTVKKDPAVTYREDYTPPAFLVDTVELDFDVQDMLTRVSSRFSAQRNPASVNDRAPLVLNGEKQKLERVVVNGIELDAQNYELTDKTLTIPFVPDDAVIEIVSTNDPSKNTALSGLYVAGPMLCTQCESEGFRNITYFQDRPDVLAKYRVTIHADKKKYPTLLSNGNLIKKGVEKGGRHYALWEDPFPKPCYLFALVAGKMDRVSDHFTTKSGRNVLLEIYVEPGRKKETGFAMDALKKAMAWDEKTYGLEYDLDRFMIVAVSYFNYGAMENKGLNIFNDVCVLGRADTVTDAEIAFFERVVGHEYFHNYTGDRVTCRDWFQLSLKEGLTVYREQQFCGNMNSRSVERLHSVIKLRARQFPEDAGAMAHPIRPDSYQAIENFYTGTIYEKGAEVIRMIETLVGAKGFRKGLSLYLKRHDGQAATCDDFVKAMEEANDIDLDHFMLWYSQSGTPVLDVTSSYNAKKKEYTLRVKQSCAPTPGQKTKYPLNMPFCVGLLDEKGRDMKGTFVLDIASPEEVFVFLNVETKPIPSLLRGFSAPVRVMYPYTEEELRIIMAKDTDGFNRWEAAQKLFSQYVMAGDGVPPAFIKSLKQVMKDRKLDAATKAMMLSVPSVNDLGLQIAAQGKKIDPVKLHHQRQSIVKAIAAALADELWAIYESIEQELDEKASDGVARGKRGLKNLCLSYLSKVDVDTVEPLAVGTVTSGRNMTDKIVALTSLVGMDVPSKAKMLAFFAQKYAAAPATMDHWLSVQASAAKADVLKDVKKLMKHAAFSIKNPNRVRALIGAFADNPMGFHAADGSGYVFLAEIVAKLDKMNPNAAVRQAKTFLRWRDFEPKRAKLMKAALEKLAALPKLSPNTREVLQKALGK
ncbi:MAG: aminopeptidase N [Alphaproteobacteria bacterium]|nr:aminopeptidase N [Alphaproteobacteria bacterium]